MTLSPGSLRTLRDLGWSIESPMARRPTAVPVSDVLRIGEDVIIDERNGEFHLVELGVNR